MLYYGTSLIGSSHIEKGSVCQDSHKAVVLPNGWVVASVADGVGSAKHSEIASRIAVETVTEVCAKMISDGTKISECKPIIFEAYKLADMRIADYADEKEDSITEYDTTLSTIIYDGKSFAYGHSGDGGIVGLLTDGKYQRITYPQKAEDGVCVIPLRAGENSWEIGVVNGEFASLLLATDGVYDTFFPYLLKGQENEIYVPLIRYFMDNNWLDASKENIKEISQSREAFLNSEAYSPVSDDKTVLVVINPNIKPTFQSDEYYAEPDWNKLQLEWNKKAYPHLYNVKKDTEGYVDTSDEKEILTASIMED